MPVIPAFSREAKAEQGFRAGLGCKISSKSIHLDYVRLYLKERGKEEKEEWKQGERKVRKEASKEGKGEGRRRMGTGES